MAIETEFKFEVQAAQSAGVAKALTHGEACATTFETTYFDTDALDLKSRGMQIRLRRSEDRLMQTFKSKTLEAGPFGRIEAEMDVTDGTLNLRHLRAQLPKALRTDFDSWSLKPQFVTKFRRLSMNVGENGFLCEQSFDTGEIIANGQRSEIREFEIELIQGPMQAYSSACLEFLDRVPTGILLEGKAARGFRLACNGVPEAVAGNKEPLAGDMVLPDAILALLRRHFAQFLDNQPAVVRGGTPPAFHQMRVGIRRLRSVLQSFSPVLDLEGAKPLLDELRELFVQLGGVREADVFLGETLAELNRCGLRDDQSTLLKKEAARYRSQNYGALRTMLTSPGFARFVVRLNDWIESGSWLASDRPLDQLLQHRPLREFAEQRIRSLESRLFRKAQKARSGSLDDWHGARIAAKKLRYATTPMLATYFDDGHTTDYENRLSDLQDNLGMLNDLNTIKSFLAQVRSGVSRGRLADFDAAAEFCRGWSMGTTQVIVASSDALLHDFENFVKRANDGTVR